MTEYDTEFAEFRNKNLMRCIDSADKLMAVSQNWMNAVKEFNYGYNFTWFGTPIIQFPQDIQLVQEVINEVRPTLIVETGVARGGSVKLSASLLAILDLMESFKDKKSFKQRRKVIGIDIDIRDHTWAAINDFELHSYIELIQGSSVDLETISNVRKSAEGHTNTLVFLDSNHTHDHVFAELEAYSELVSIGSYIIVFDTSIEFDESDYWQKSNRPWGPGNSPKTAVDKFLEQNQNFAMARQFDAKLGITVCPFGVVKRIK